MCSQEKVRDRAFEESWKKVLENYFWSFLDFYFPDIAHQIDRTQGYLFLDQELAQIIHETKDQKRVIDKLARIYDKNQQEMWLLIHLEIQSYQDPDFARRMFVYHYRIFEKYQKPAASLAILTDPIKSFRQDSFTTEVFGKTFVHFRFPMIKLLDWLGRESELEKDPNPFAIVT